ncbi:glycosyltransferase family 4 protein [candidate division KSB1 bacterium]|nr:glycosyltransferase family 4 protein [candidate division KSB1 bacterium]
MRILMTNWNYAPEFSGAGLQCHRLSLELVKLGIKVEVLTGTKNKQLVGCDYIDGIKVNRVLRDKTTTMRHIRYGWDMFRFIIKNHSKFDLIHSHGFIAPVNLAAKLTGLPLVQKITNFNVDDPITVRKRQFGYLFMSLFNMSRVIVPTSSLLEKTCEQQKRKEQFYTRLSNGVNPNLFRPVPEEEKINLRHRFSIPEDHVVLLTVGSVNYNKGMDLMIKALSELKRTISKKFTLLIVGPNKLCRNYALGTFKVDEFSQKMLKLIGDSDLYKNIKFEGVQANIQEYMQAADIYIHASRQEGQPNAVIEAMACGLPVVANYLPGITDELLQNGKYGYVVNCENTKEFASGIRVLINNDNLRKRIAAYARVEVLQSYNLWKIAEKYRSLYYRVLHHESVHDTKTLPSNQSLLSILNNIKLK